MLAFHQENVFAVISAHTNLQPISHVERLIRELVEQRVPIAVASSSSPALIEMILTKSNLKSYFSVIVSGEEVSQGKPAPDIFLHAAKELGVSPSVCLVIEDSHHGVKAAKSAGMRCIGYQNLNSGKQDLSCADHIVTSYEELWRLQIK
jgi:HAD superfamily hydrolase (TIGR01509 family)